MSDRFRPAARAARHLLYPVCLAALLLSGCTLPRHDAFATFDLGLTTAPASPASAAVTPRALPAISVAEPDVPAWLDRPRMVYRLAYANDQQAHVYATSRWTMPPGDLFTLRLKSRFADAGGVVVPASDSAVDMPLLRMELDDFSQIFRSPAQSTGRVAMRVSLFRDRVLLAQRRFVVEVPAPTPDAEGGVDALRRASDQIIEGIMQWLSTLPPHK